MDAQRLLSHRLTVTMALVAIILITTAVAGATEPRPQGPMTTGFTYQGRLANDGGDPIDDSCDFQFGLWDDPDAGSPVGPALNLPGVAVTGGLFTVQLDFGEVFDGTALWLEVAVHCSGDPGYTTLGPRQALTAAPYALYAHSADLLDGSHASAFAPAAHGHWGASWTGLGTGLTLSGGVIGLSGSGSDYGVVGQGHSIGGYGLYGLASATTGTNYGVYGLAQATDGYAVGVYGRSESTQGRGVIGYVPSATGDTIGVHGKSVSGSGGRGVYGWDAATSGAGIGVQGESNSPNGYGGWFASYSTSAITTQAGLFALNDSDSGYGVVGYNRHNGTGLGAWSKTGSPIMAFAGDYPASDFPGNLRFWVNNNGQAYAYGWNIIPGFPEMSGAGNTEYRALYTMTSAEAWAEDFGRATLQDGTATVTIDPLFAQTVNLALEYHIYLTPICRDLVVLAVTDQQPDSFTVQGATLDGKPSGCAFDYRIVAKQRGYEDQRLEKVDIPEPVEVGRDGSPPPGGAGAEPGGGR